MNEITTVAKISGSFAAAVAAAVVIVGIALIARWARNLADTLVPDLGIRNFTAQETRDYLYNRLMRKFDEYGRTLITLESWDATTSDLWFDALQATITRIAETPDSELWRWFGSLGVSES